MNTKETMRQAYVRGTGLRKRCRKPEKFGVHAIGRTDAEALEKLQAKISEKLEGYKSFDLALDIEIYNVEVSHDQYGMSVMQSCFPDIFPEQNKYIKVPTIDMLIAIGKELVTA